MAPMPLLRCARSRDLLSGPFFSVLGCVLALAGTVAGQSGAREPIRIAYDCAEADADALGLTCTMEDPCPVFLELASAEAAGGRLIAAGNLHTKNVTLYGIVLASEDNGVTWTEPHERIRAAALEQAEFLDLQNGWINGESIDPLDRDPFLLITNDGGRTWRQKLVVDDTKYATVAQFHFDTPSHGELVLDASQRNNVRQELYETMTGGESWELKQVNHAPIRLKNARAPNPSAINQGSVRIRADAASGAFVVERGGGRTWDRVASFAVHITDCQ
jgi:hypothetical protein